MIIVKDVENIRKSQFVLIYGPGAIIESRKGPRIIPSINNGLDEFFNQETLKKFEITDQRLRIAIRNIKQEDARIFSIPSNASLGKPDSEAIYHTYIFPTWKICYGREGNHEPVLYNGVKCPICNKKNDDSSAVRFVVACVNGHLDEVDWKHAVHHKSDCNYKCDPEYYYWIAGGSALSDITVKCPTCQCSTTMKEIYSTKFDCTGRRPEEETPDSLSGNSYFTHVKKTYNCDKKMRVIQIQSSSLHIPETITLLTLPDYDSNLYNIMQQETVFSAITTVIQLNSKPCEEIIGKEDTIEGIKRSLKKQKISDESIQIIEKSIKEEGVEIFCNIFQRLADEKRTFLDFIYEEFESLKAGPRTTDNFSMLPGRSLPHQDEIEEILPDLKVFPIEKLKTITAQTGYYRIPVPDDHYTVVSTGKSSMDGIKWYPGYESIGEGIFLTFSNGCFSKFSESRAYNEWKNEKTSSLLDFSGELWGNIQHEPMFVWWHTLSHALIRAISLYSGYSSASLRERVYINPRFDDGGILIYTSSPGEDGSMGGLVGTVDTFSEILKKAIDGIRFCSNDPLCFDVRKTSGRINGAACYSCLLIPETSCEHKNMWLDRHILLGD